MNVISSINAIQKRLASVRGKKRGGRSLRVGLVPTMGAFHEGHLSLMKTAKRECDYVVVSLFVNPLQFGHAEDLTRYPRNLIEDRKMAETCGVDLLFAPSVETITPPDLATSVSVDSVAKRWEGASRPGHFQGVATIVAKLFQIIKPDVAYFGQKDYQQTVVIRKMVDDLHFDLKLRILPTVRERSGLAKSSRNRFLSVSEKQAATVLYCALSHAEQLVKKGKRDCDLLRKEVESVLRSEPRIAVDYAAFCDPETLEPVDRIIGKTALLLAARIGSVRLIDNVILKPRSPALTKSKNVPSPLRGERPGGG